MELSDSGPNVSLPDVAFEPLQLPLATHPVALVDDQLSVVVPPAAIEFGDALSVTVGAGGPNGLTVTVTVLAATPPAPLHVIVNAEVEVSGPIDSVPLAPREPLQPPDALQPVALVEFQIRTLLPP